MKLRDRVKTLENREQTERTLNWLSDRMSKLEQKFDALIRLLNVEVVDAKAVAIYKPKGGDKLE